MKYLVNLLNICGMWALGIASIFLFVYGVRYINHYATVYWEVIKFYAGGFLVLVILPIFLGGILIGDKLPWRK